MYKVLKRLKISKKILTFTITAGSVNIALLKNNRSSKLHSIYYSLNCHIQSFKKIGKLKKFSVIGRSSY